MRGEVEKAEGGNGDGLIGRGRAQEEAGSRERGSTKKERERKAGIRGMREEGDNRGRESEARGGEGLKKRGTAEIRRGIAEIGRRIMMRRTRRRRGG